MTLLICQLLQYVTNVQIGFYFSACGGPWSQTKDSLTNPDANPLVVKERLCCKPDPENGGRPSYFRCDGGVINKSCAPRDEESVGKQQNQ